MDFENYDPSFPDQPVVDLYLPLWANLPAFRSKPAFVWVEDGSAGGPGGGSTSTLTYSGLNDSVQLISGELVRLLRRGDTVVILCSPGLAFVEIIFACQRAGFLSVPIFPPDSSFSRENYHQLVRAIAQTKPKAAIASRDYIESVEKYVSLASNNPKLSESLRSVRWIAAESLKDAKVKPKPDSSSSSSYSGCKPDEPYLIQYTSGATGIPKPVIVSAGSAAHNVRMARKAYDLHPNTSIVSWLPQYHDCGLMFLLLTIVSGATCVLASPTDFVRRPRMWLELVSSFRATCTPVPLFALPLVVKRGGPGEGTSPISLWSLKNLIIVNEPIYKSAIDEFVKVFEPFGLSPFSISPSYGLAENCTFVSTSWKSKTRSLDFPTHNKLFPVAKLSSSDEEEEEDDLEIVVVDEETHETVEDGKEGEIWVSSPSNASGYLGHPSLTREIFHGRLINQVSRRFVRTGDRGIIRGAERYLYVTGRCSDIIKLHGSKEIHPHFIETAAYNSCPKFLRGGCLAAFEISGMLILVAEVLKRNERRIEDLRRVCEEIDKYVLKEANVKLGRIFLVESGSIPKTTSGKIQRWAAMNKLIEGKMSLLMRFESNNGVFSWKCRTGMDETEGEEGRRGYKEGKEEGVMTFMAIPPRSALLSLL